MNLFHGFGNIDIYLFDQILKGRFDDVTSILDAGCGQGRNLVYFLQNGFDVYGIDQDENSISNIQELARQLASQIPLEHFCVADLRKIPFDDSRFDAVISNAVLHFADDEKHFRQMLNEIWRVLKPGGLFFCRLATSIGIESRIKQLAGRRYALPDGSTRFLVDEVMLLSTSERLGGKLLDPIKTTNVQNLRCMTTWCLRKHVWADKRSDSTKTGV